ncbi:MAG: head-tail adaptor protein [Acidimicrobiia bacterium]
MITDDELTAMRAVLDQSLPDLADISRSTPTSDGRGGTSLVWATVASVPCRIAPAATFGGSEQPVNDVVAGVQRWSITLPAGTNVTGRDRVLVGARTFEVVEVRSTRSYEVSCRVTGVEVL